MDDGDVTPVTQLVGGLVGDAARHVGEPRPEIGRGILKAISLGNRMLKDGLEGGAGLGQLLGQLINVRVLLVVADAL
jgi:hypothetical protein